MKITSATLLFFSPTGTTRSVLLEICRGMEVESHRIIDLTLPALRQQQLPEEQEDIILLGVPVYEARVPFLIRQHISQYEGRNRPVVVVALYGHVVGGSVLADLAKATQKNGLCIVAAAFFIGEHSFANDKVPLAKGRPDQKDLELAREFGRKIKRKLDETDPREWPKLKLPIKQPLSVRLMPFNKAHLLTFEPAVDNTKCVQCKACVGVCPTGAIDGDSLKITSRACLRCFACAKFCPAGARTVRHKYGIFTETFFRWAGRKRKEPELFL